MAAPCYHSFSRTSHVCEYCGLPKPIISRPDPSRLKKIVARSREPVRLEKFEQRDAVDLLEKIGAQVYEIGRPRQQKCHACGAQSKDLGTRQTPGIPDLFVFLPIGAPLAGRPLYCWIEMKSTETTKRKDGGLSDEQRAFREFCRLRQIPHVDGTFEAVVKFLSQHGFIRE